MLGGHGAGCSRLSSSKTKSGFGANNAEVSYMARFLCSAFWWVSLHIKISYFQVKGSCLVVTCSRLLGWSYSTLVTLVLGLCGGAQVIPNKRSASNYSRLQCKT